MVTESDRIFQNTMCTVNYGESVRVGPKSTLDPPVVLPTTRCSGLFLPDGLSVSTLVTGTTVSQTIKSNLTPYVKPSFNVVAIILCPFKSCLIVSTVNFNNIVCHIRRLLLYAYKSISKSMSSQYCNDA